MLKLLSPDCRVFAVAVALLGTTDAMACSSCGCNLTSDWLSQGLVATPGTTFSLRYDYVPQTNYLTGTRPVDRAAFAPPSEREIERRTDNHYVTLSLDHSIDSDWAIEIQLPFLARPHSTVLETTSGLTRSVTAGLGDVRLAARFQGFGGAGISGVQFGLKLPTGDIHQRFSNGPGAGDEADRGLQPGSGTLNLFLGFYHFGRLVENVDYVAQLGGEVPVTDGDRYRPGTAGTASLGLNYTRWRTITPQVQLNFRASGRDRGDNADFERSGGETLYVAPGLAARLAYNVSAFTIVQVPLYQRVVGFQLVPRATVSFGLNYRY